MGKDMFVTSGLCRIREQIAASSRKSVTASADEESGMACELQSGNARNAPETVSAPVKQYDFEALSPEMKRALILREEEFERFRKEAALRLHELELTCSRNREEANRILEKCSSSEEKLHRLQEALEGLEALDRTQESYRKVLAENCRKLDHIRLNMLDVKEWLRSGIAGENTPGKGGNLFAELDSVTFSQLFRIALSLSLPLILTLLAGVILLGVMMLLTFRVGL